MDGRTVASRGGHLVQPQALPGAEEGRGRSRAVWETPRAVLPDHHTHPSLRGLRGPTPGGEQIGLWARAPEVRAARPSRPPGGLQLCGGRAAGFGGLVRGPGEGARLWVGPGGESPRSKTVDRRLKEEKRNRDRG